MPVRSIEQILADTVKDDVLAKHFLGVWPVVESILESFSKATKLPIFVFFNDSHVFTSSLETMPNFCRHMVEDPETAKLCFGDGQRRAAGAVPNMRDGVQMCHAGMLNGRREIQTGIGTMTILFGSKKSASAEAIKRREQIVQLVALRDESQAERLREAGESDVRADDFEKSDLALMDAITDILQRLINATVGFRLQAINMAHELSLMMINLGLLTKFAGPVFSDYKQAPSAAIADKLVSDLELIDTQCRLGLYIVRNFFSSTSETRYKEVMRPRFTDVNLESLLDETINLHRLLAAEKRVSFECSYSKLPMVHGFDMELRRLFSNILNNAIKYSYHSVTNAQRIIRVKSKVPYDPGFKRPRFAVSFENYGLGLTGEEHRNVFRPGFRGRQALAEVPIGSGIGLSEADKIMKLHRGEIKLQSKELYQGDKGMSTYLTTVDLIFPYVPERDRR